MAEEDDAQKTEDPTDKKLSRAREKGQVASSQEVKSWVVLLAGAAGIVFMSPIIADDIRVISIPYLENVHAIPSDFEGMRHNLIGSAIEVGLAVAPLFLLIVLFALAGNIMQFGLLFAPEKVKPDFEKVSPMKGLKRMFSMRSVVEFGKGILKLVIVSAVALGITLPLMQDITLMPGFSMAAIMDRILNIAILLAAGTIAVMTAIAALDFMFQKYQFTKSMRMSKQEVKDEHKQSEGDPQVKARIRSLRQQRARERMMAAVPEADVVITNPTHYAVALQYEIDEMSAPRLVAKGVDTLAFRIREVAEEHDIPIVENPPLARALHASVEIDEEIPPEHFVAVAEVIGYVMRLKGKTIH
ncbi:MAG: flagellar biosynthesis protein FlhB [Rhodospirillales bacterium]|nr:flagellar biosynthesis protein FlhB [Rhodospirillales bacterium]MBO6787409.1 flagellar biosynthesis protein FlhB [Rhodospirillales bacterium]